VDRQGRDGSASRGDAGRRSHRRPPDGPRLTRKRRRTSRTWKKQEMEKESGRDVRAPMQPRHAAGLRRIGADPCWPPVMPAASDPPAPPPGNGIPPTELSLGPGKPGDLTLRGLTRNRCIAGGPPIPDRRRQGRGFASWICTRIDRET
jgi:hypothetical protein